MDHDAVHRGMLEKVFDCDCEEDDKSGTSMVETCTILSREADDKKCGGYTLVDDEECEDDN